MSASSDVKEMFTSEIAEVTDGGAEDDEFVLTEAHVVAIRMIFKEFDADGSGSIERGELSKLCAALGDPLTKRELEEAAADNGAVVIMNAVFDPTGSGGGRDLEASSAVAGSDKLAPRLKG